MCTGIKVCKPKAFGEIHEEALRTDDKEFSLILI